MASTKITGNDVIVIDGHGMRCPSGTVPDLAIARSWVQILPVAAMYQCQLSVPSLWGQLMNSSLWAMGWRPSVADWGSGMSVVLHRGSTCPLSRAMNGCIQRRGTISSFQSAGTSKIVKRCCSRVFSCKQRCIKYPDLYLYSQVVILCRQSPSVWPGVQVIGELTVATWQSKWLTSYVFPRSRKHSSRMKWPYCRFLPSPLTKSTLMCC